MPKDKKITEESVEEMVPEVEEVVETPVEEKKPDGFNFGYVISDGTFLRAEPSKYGLIVSILKKGDIIAIDLESGDFYFGTANGKVGYVNKDQIKIK